ncbi:MAG: hypothetical protein FWH15_00340 [Betaproteobacteria bacterium]|nr:hypothetical protein [Betaproteobacteria bacterium]
MRLALVLSLAVFAGVANAAYSAHDLHGDCKHAEVLLAEKPDMLDAMAGARCLGYLQGFADGHGITETLAKRVDIEFSVFCLPQDIDILRLVRAVLLYLSRNPLPPETLAAVSADRITIAALSRAFACADERDD